MPELFDSSDLPANHNHSIEDGSVVPPQKKKHVDEYSEVAKSETPTKNSLQAFNIKPNQICFDSQMKDEQVILMLREHPITQVKWVLIAIGLALAPLLFGAVGLVDFLPVKFQLASTIGWYLIVLGFSLESFLSWFYNVFIITDERVVDVDFHSLIYKNISAAKLDNIEDITSETGGAMRSIFNFGTIKIQTAAAQSEFEFYNVPQPSKVTRLLNEMLLEEEKEKMEGRVS